MIVWLAEVTYDYEQGHTVGIYSTKEKALAALKNRRESNPFEYGEDHVAEWEMDATDETVPIAEVVKATAIAAGVSIAYAHWLRSKGL